MSFLRNGIVTATIDPGGAAVLSLKYRGHEMVSAEAAIRASISACPAAPPTSSPAIACIRSPAGSRITWTFPASAFMRRVTSSPGTLISFCPAKRQPRPVCLCRRQPSRKYPDAGMGEWRMVWSMPEEGGDTLLERIYVDELRHWQMPSSYDFAHAQPTGIKEIVKLTTGPWAGKYDCKYMYTADLWKEGAYGHASDKNRLGAWVVFGGYDYFNDGPTKNDLTSAAGLIHIMLYAEHYNGKGFTIPHGKAWSKIYGPWLLYLNDKPTGDAAGPTPKRRRRRKKPPGRIPG